MFTLSHMDAKGIKVNIKLSHDIVNQIIIGGVSRLFGKRSSVV
jgi:hypothetical protein